MLVSSMDLRFLVRTAGVVVEAHRFRAWNPFLGIADLYFSILVIRHGSNLKYMSYAVMDVVAVAPRIQFPTFRNKKEVG